MGEIIHLSRERIQIIVYTGYCAPWRKTSRCREESKQTLAIVDGLVKELGQWYFDVQERSWLRHCYEVIPRGGWHAPVIMVGRTVITQATVPDAGRLRKYLKEQVRIVRPRLAKSS
jgi:hypothetical protein